MQDRANLLLSIQRIRKLYERQCKAVTQPYALTKNELDVLLFLANNPAHDTAGEIVRCRGLTKSHVCKSVESLTARGYLTGERGTADKRLIHLRVLPAAQPVVEAGRAMQQAFFSRLYEGLSRREHDTFDAVFHKIIQNAQEAWEHGD